MRWNTEFIGSVGSGVRDVVGSGNTVVDKTRGKRAGLKPDDCRHIQLRGIVGSPALDATEFCQPARVEIRRFDNAPSTAGSW